ncbi:aldo/keto reductase [Dactylosporangium sp. CA-139066]|uniref:aldo/keto reductase n=1 Tax=Dactylosporangium sp. CA-139066 TaxID=3239930 RepID=UPI003D9410CF
MKYASLAEVDAPVSRCVLGTSGIRDETGYPLLDAFVAAGGSCIDTARVYGGGRCEETVGGWIRRARPDGLVIVGKGAHPPHCTPAAVEPELLQTLDRLGVPTIDVYLLHRDDTSIPVGEFVDALERQVAAGRIRAYGGSNWSEQRVRETNDYARRHGLRGMTVVSNHFSLAEPVEPLYPGCAGVSRSYCDYLAEDGIALMPWSSQARGFFADVPRGDLDPNVWRCWGTPDNYARRERARQLAERLAVRAVNVALAYVLCQSFATLPIIGPRTVAELEIALAGTDVSLSEQDIAWLEHGESGVDRRETG